MGTAVSGVKPALGLMCYGVAVNETILIAGAHKSSGLLAKNTAFRYHVQLNVQALAHYTALTIYL